MKPKDRIWVQFHKAKDNSVVCKYCEKKYKFANVNKMKNHIKKCVKSPETIRNESIKEKPISETIVSANSNVQLGIETRPTGSVPKKITEFLDVMSVEVNVSIT